MLEHDQAQTAEVAQVWSVCALGRNRTTWVTPEQAEPARVIAIGAIVPLRERGC